MTAVKHPPARPSRDVAARELARYVVGRRAADFLVNLDDVRAAYETAMTDHRSCGCQQAVNLTLWRDVLLGAPEEGRLL